MSRDGEDLAPTCVEGFDGGEDGGVLLAWRLSSTCTLEILD